MRILIFNWRDTKNPLAGGAEVNTHNLAKRWVEKSHKVTIFCSSFPGAKEEDRIDGVNIIRKGNRFSCYWRAYKYYRTIGKDKFDIVIDEINTVPFFTPFYVKKSRIALINQLTGKVYFRMFPKIPAVILYLLEPFVFRVYKRTPIVVLCESTKEELLKIGFKTENIYPVPPGIKQFHFPPVKKAPFPSIIYLNRLVKYKNIEDLIFAFNLVKKKIPLAKLFIGGCRGNRYELKLRKLAVTLNLEKDIEFFPFLDEKEKAEKLQGAWIHVLPSTKEGWGISVIEAAFRGTPSIGYDVPGLRDSIKDGETGLLVSLRNINKLAAAIEKLFKDISLREKLSQKSIEYAKQFSWDRSAEKFLRTIENAINNEK